MFGLPVAARSGAARNTPGMVSNVLPLRLAMQCRDDQCPTPSRGLQRKSGASLDHQRFQVARSAAGESAMSTTAVRCSVSILNIMRFDYDFRFAGHRTEVGEISPSVRSKIFRSRSMTVATAARCRSISMPTPSAMTPTMFAVHPERFPAAADRARRSPTARSAASTFSRPAERRTILTRGTTPRARSPDATMPAAVRRAGRPHARTPPRWCSTTPR